MTMPIRIEAPIEAQARQNCSCPNFLEIGTMRDSAMNQTHGPSNDAPSQELHSAEPFVSSASGSAATLEPPTQFTIAESALTEAKKFYGAAWDSLNINRLCTGDYLTVVELTDGAQGFADNLGNIHGPHQRNHDWVNYDKELVHLSREDRLLEKTLLQRKGLDEIAQSVKIALLNSLSLGQVTALCKQDRAGLSPYKYRPGFIPIADALRAGDTVAMIGCIGSFSCGQIGESNLVGTVYFNDFEYCGKYKWDVEQYVARTFVRPSIVNISDGSNNEKACRCADVVVVTSDALCTDTMDDVLLWANNARAVYIVGWSYCMHPRHVQERAVQAFTTMIPRTQGIASRMAERSRSPKRGTFDDEVKSMFWRGHVACHATATK